jgi:hypothetical protein
LKSIQSLKVRIKHVLGLFYKSLEIMVS